MRRDFLLGLLVLTLFANLAKAAPNSLWGVNRTILQYRNGPPSNFVDPNHAQMLQIGAPNPIYTPADVVKLNTESENFFLSTFGLDFRLSNPNITLLPGGIRILFAPAIPPAQPTEIARWVPTIFGVDGLYNVLLDARYCHGEWCTREGRWTVRNVSNLVLFAVPGVFPVQPPGTPPSPLLGYRAGDIISYGYTNHLRIDSNWNYRENREQYIVRTTTPINQVPVNYISPPPGTPSEIHGESQFIDRCGRIGTATDTTIVSFNFGILNQLTHYMVTFRDDVISINDAEEDCQSLDSFWRENQEPLPAEGMSMELSKQ